MHGPEVSTIVVVIFSGAPIVIGGSTGCIFPDTQRSFTKDVMRLDFPVFSSPQTTILTDSAIIDGRLWLPVGWMLLSFEGGSCGGERTAGSQSRVIYLRSITYPTMRYSDRAVYITVNRFCALAWPHISLIFDRLDARFQMSAI